MRDKLLVLLLGLALLGITYVATTAHTIEQNTQDLRTEKGIAMDPATATWKSAGITITVTTNQQQGESDADWAARHRRRVTAMLLQFLQDP
jgi:hypothetical protein